MKQKFKFYLLILAAILLAGSPADAACWQWSKTASSNATADPSINWSEGMAPSAVNDSARAMMARLAECRDDISGALQAGGTSTAYTVTTNQGLDSPPVDGQMIAFVPNVTNDLNATLAADGGTAYPLVTSSASSGIAAGVAIAGTPYRITFVASPGVWVLNSFFGNPFSVPLGGLTASTVDTPPNSSFVLPAGQCISRTTYAEYFALVGTRFGACDGVTTFAVIDMRGRLPAAIDNLNGTAANRITSAANGCGVAFTSIGVACGAQNNVVTTPNLPPYTPSGSIANGAITSTPTVAGLAAMAGNKSIVFSNAGSGVFGSYTNPGESQFLVVNSTQAPSSFSGVAQGGTSTPMGVLPPIIGVTYFLRVK